MYSFLDKVFRWMRFRKVKRHISKESVVCDIGCGSEAYFLKNILGLIKCGVGLDKDIKEYKDSKIELKNLEVFENIPLEGEKFDVITIMAVLEHLDYPQEVLKESFRLLKKGGKLIVTTPTPLSKPILEALAFKLGLINKESIQEHKNYFWPKDIKKMLLESGFKEGNIKNYFFEIFLNNFIIAQK